MKKNVASQIIGIQMINATTGAAFTGAVTAYVTGDGGVQAIGSVGAGLCTSEGNGFHTYTPAQAETNYDHIGFSFIGTGAVPATLQIYTQFPQSVDNNTAITALNDFDPAVDTVANVALVATTTTNTDMRGTDSAATAANLATVDTVVDSILVDTGTTIPAQITALNNVEAKILVGTSQPYATNTVTQSSDVATTGTELNFLDIGVKLYVTPTINRDGFVSMKIKPEVSSPGTPYEYPSGDSTVEVPVVKPIEIAFSSLAVTISTTPSPITIVSSGVTSKTFSAVSRCSGFGFT